MIEKLDVRSKDGSIALSFPVTIVELSTGNYVITLDMDNIWSATGIDESRAVESLVRYIHNQCCLYKELSAQNNATVHAIIAQHWTEKQISFIKSILAVEDPSIKLSESGYKYGLRCL